MPTELVKQEQDLSATLMESVLLGGDLSKLSAPDRVKFYRAVCNSLGLNPLTRPFQYIILNGKLQFYASKDATEQLRKINGVSITIVKRDVVEDVYVVTARATDRNGRTDESVGAVPLGVLKGEQRANAIMKAETKAKRRVTLSICGLGMLDTSEADSVPMAQRVHVDDAGEITPELPAPEAKEAQAKLLAAKVDEAATENKNRDKGWFKVMLEGFAAIKEEIGDADYYRILGANGFEHANQLPDRKTAQAVYKEMLAVRSIQSEDPEANAPACG